MTLDDLDGGYERLSATEDRPIIVTTNDGAKAMNFDEFLATQISDGAEYAEFAVRVARTLLRQNVYNDSDSSGSVNAYYFVAPRFEPALREQVEARSDLVEEARA